MVTSEPSGNVFDLLGLVGVQADRVEHRLADCGERVVVRLVEVVHEDVALVGVEVDVSLGERLVRLDVVGELHQFDVDALLLQVRDDDLIPDLVAVADHADLDGGAGVCRAAVPARRQTADKRCDRQYRRSDSPDLHVSSFPLVSCLVCAVCLDAEIADRAH